MNAYVLKDGRVFYGESFDLPDDFICMPVEKLPSKEGCILLINGFDDGKKLLYEFIEIPKEEPEPQPTEQDLLNAQILLNQAEQDAKLQEIDEALALILLNQEGGIENVL